jgi:O-antigen/teichoic acid export membrane protein
MEESTRSQLRKILEGISIKFTGTLLSRIVGFATTLLLTNYLTTGQYGTYAYALGLLALVGPLKQFGAINSLKKLVPKYEGEPHEQRLVVDISVSTTFLGNVLISIILFYFAPLVNSITVNEPLFVPVFRIVVAVHMFESFRRTIQGSLLGFKKPIPSNVIDGFAYPVIKITAVTVSILLSLTIIEIMGSLLLGSIIGFLVSLYAYQQVVPVGIGFRLPRFEKISREYYDFAGTILFNRLGNTLFTKIDIVVLGFFVSSSLVGVYRVSWLLSSVIYLPVIGAGQVFPAIISQYNEADKKDELRSVYDVVSRWTFSLSLILLLGALIYSDQLLALFGEEYKQGGQILMIIAIAQFIGSWAGTSGQVLLMHGHQRLQTAQLWVFGGVNLILNILLIPRFGAIGAVTAMFIGYVSLNIAQVAEVWYLEGLLPVSKPFLKPAAAGTVAGGAMVFAQNLLSGTVLLFVGGGTGVLVFLVTLILLGIEEIDKELIRSVTG